MKIHAYPEAWIGVTASLILLLSACSSGSSSLSEPSPPAPTEVVASQESPGLVEETASCTAKGDGEFRVTGTKLKRADGVLTITWTTNKPPPSTKWFLSYMALFDDANEGFEISYDYYPEEGWSLSFLDYSGDGWSGELPDTGSLSGRTMTVTVDTDELPDLGETFRWSSNVQLRPSSDPNSEDLESTCPRNSSATVKFPQEQR